ncbi:larval cuticle protein 16/17-like [Nymphalis io]|uniref:larval cuticle protein 16/17-like n=1 Tax=Inachis io TaxID=171585 RepID=UPI0021680B17|nr:larval cuticle protein 16/17-like [Nymphalis io]
MKMIIIALAIVAVVAAAPVEKETLQPKILRSEFDQLLDGSYSYSYETENGINLQEKGELKETIDEDNKPHSVVVVRGSFSYTNDQGKLETITYYADETGFHPEGDSIPKVPASRR